jgi:hypothetical protein
MKLGFVVAPLLVATTAYAQAPGDYEVSPPGMSPTAPVAQPEAPRPLRWSIGLGVGSVGLAPHHDPENETDFAIGQLALRYRATAHLEIELAVAGGREQLEDGGEGDRDVSQAVLALRYRFSPQRAWNWWIMAGMGSLTVASQYASDEEREAAAQSTLQLGVGLERRFRHFAFQVEARAVGVAPNDEMTEDVKPVPPPDMPVSSDGGVPYDPTYTYTSRDGLKGGQLTLGVSYYF